MNVIPVMIEEGEARMTITWSDQVKMDGGSMKGFARTSTGETIYAIYRFESPEEKAQFLALDFPSWQFGVNGRFEPISIPSHDYAFKMENYLKMYGAMGVFQIEEIITAEVQLTIYSRLLMQRKRIKTHIEQSFPASLIPEAEALLIGDRSGMNEDTADAYRKLGITHLFAISGLHVGLLTFIVREFLLRLKMRRENVDLFLLLFLPLYAVIAGGAPSVWRAVLVTVLILLTIYGKIPIRIDQLLAVTVIGFILLKPFIVLQPGFQLSYLAAFSLVLSINLLARTTSKLKMSFLVTMITQLALYPVLLIHFYEISISSFLMNLLYVPLYSVIILPANFLFLLFTAIAMPIAKMLFGLYIPFRQIIHEMTERFAGLPYQLWTPGKPGAVESVIAVIGIFIFFIMYEKGEKFIKCLPYIIIPVFFIQFYPYVDKELRVTFLDVGQGDSVVIELPFRRGVYMIDTGGTVSFGEPNWKTPEKEFEVGRQIVLPYLKGRGITKIDGLIISHAHLDHMGSAHEIVAELDVKEIHITPNSAVVVEMEKLLKVAGERNIPIIEKKDGDDWRERDALFSYLAPQSDVYVGNDSSLALFMRTAGPSFLFTGDMEVAAENEFLAKYKEINFGELILKVGHHGSKTSSTDPFITALSPHLAVIQAGRNNRFNHPHPEVLETFEAHHVPVLLTAEQGSITVHVENEHWTVSVMK